MELRGVTWDMILIVIFGAILLAILLPLAVGIGWLCYESIYRCVHGRLPPELEPKETNTTESHELESLPSYTP